MPFRRHDVLLFLAVMFYLVVSHDRALDAGFVTDFTGLWEKMQGKGLYEALQSFGFPSLMPVLNVFYFLLYQLFGLNGIAWFLFFAALYSVGLCFFYRLILEIIDGEHKELIALATLVLIIVSPFQVEALIWKVGLGHISAVCFFLMACYFSVRYLKSGSHFYLGLQGLCHTASLLCFEWGIVFQ